MLLPVVIGADQGFEPVQLCIDSLGNNLRDFACLGFGIGGGKFAVGEGDPGLTVPSPIDVRAGFG